MAVFIYYIRLQIGLQNTHFTSDSCREINKKKYILMHFDSSKLSDIKKWQNKK